MIHFRHIISWYTIVLLIIFTSTRSLNAQHKSIRFKHYTTDNGLPQNMVDCIIQDSKGFMWFGTWNGLCRFDGYSFKVYQHQTKGESILSNNFIYALCEDDFGNIWIGTNNGLNIYVYNKDVFLPSGTSASTLFLKSDIISSITKSKNGKIWIGSNNGLYQYSINNNNKIEEEQHFRFGDSPNELPGKTINHLMVDSKNNLWISTDGGLALLPAKDKSFIRYFNNPLNPNSIPLNNVRCTFEDKNSALWIGTHFGISKYNDSQKTFTNYLSNPLKPNSLIHNSVMSITEDSGGNIVIGTLGGLSILSEKNPGHFVNYKKKTNSEYDLNNDFINCVYTDKWGNVWIGTERGGINKYNSTKKEFDYFESEINNNNSLNNNTINSIYEDDTYLWIGTAGGGLNRYHKSSKQFKHYTSHSKNGAILINNFVTALGRDNQNNLWVGTWGGGLHKLMNEGESNEVFQTYNSINTNNDLISDYISSFSFDDNDNCWIGTLGGLIKYDPINNSFEHLSIEKTGYDINQIGALKIDHKKNLWLGTRTGLFKIKLSANTNNYLAKRYMHKMDRANSLSGNYIISICEDSNNNLWLGTYGFGLNKLESDGEDGSFTNYSTNDGLPNNIIYSITEDNNGNLWLTTDYGLSKYNVSENMFRNYFAADGLQNNQYYWAAAYKNKNGKLYFGGMNGLNTFYPEWITDDTNPPHIAITDFKIFNKSIIPSFEYHGKVATTTPITTTEKINLSYKSKDFSFEFSTLDYEQPTMNQYAYRLVGFDQNWYEVSSNRRFANYTNLKPGKYTFQVKATNSHGEWMKKPKEIELEISPPFWQTWWFRITVFLSIIVLFLSYIRYRDYAYMAQQKKLEKQVLERTLEIEKQKEKLEEKNIQLAQRQSLIEGQKEKLEGQNKQILNQRNKLIDLNKKVKLVNQLKLRFFTNVSHEFRTPLTLILGPLESLILNSTKYDTNTQKSLSLINRNAQRLLQLINQLMDFRKLEQGKMKISVSNVNLRSFLSNTILSFSDLASQKQIKLSLIDTSFNEETWFDFRKVENILYNLLSNAFKHTPSGGKIWVQAYKGNKNSSIPQPSITSDFITIEIGDTGYGIDKEKLPHIFDRFYQVEADTLNEKPTGTGIGLSLTKELIENHAGEINVSSTVNNGSTFYVHLPYKKNNYDSNIISEQQYDPSHIQKQVDALSNELLAVNKEQKQDKSKRNKTNNRPTLLIAEDNLDLREFIAYKLNDHYNIIEAENGKIGYERATSENPDIIISDIMMPEMDGLEFCSRIKTNLVTSHIPVILLTAKGSIENQIEGLETGADIYLPKPFNFELLNAHITNLIDSRKKLYDAFLVKTKIESKDIVNTSLDDKFMNKLLKIIEVNIDNPELNVNMCLKELGISRTLLHRKITALTNMSTIEFITNIRLKKSTHLLKNNDINISEVAYAVGFNDPKYFSRIFRKQFGKTPSEFQQDALH